MQNTATAGCLSELSPQSPLAEVAKLGRGVRAPLVREGLKKLRIPQTTQ